MFNKQEGRTILDTLIKAGRRAGVVEVDEDEAVLIGELARKIVPEKGPTAMSDFQDFEKVDSPGLEHVKDYWMAYVLDHAEDYAVRAAAYRYVSRRVKEDINIVFSGLYEDAMRRYKNGEELPPIDPVEAARLDAKMQRYK